MVMLAKSVASGLSVADTTDSVGGPMARAMAERGEALDADAEAARGTWRNPHPDRCVPLKLGAALFASSNPSVSAGIDRSVAHGRIRVVVVGAGGSTLVHVPVEKIAGGGIA
jgi:hypothetical protein